MLLKVSSPFVLSADASTCSSQTVAAMGYSIDDSSNTTIVNSTSVQAAITSAPGAHTLHVKALGQPGCRMRHRYHSVGSKSCELSRHAVDCRQR